MKRVLTIALVAVMAAAAGIGSASAQKFELGVRAGVGSQNMDIPDNVFEAKSRLGWNAAVVARMRIIGFGDGFLGAGLFFQPEVVYSQSSNRVRSNMFYELTQPVTRASSDADFAGATKVKMQTVDVPLLLSLKVSIARVQAGPVFHLMNNYAIETGHLEFQPPLRSAVGYALGASVDLLGLTVDARYMGDFGKLKNNITDSGHLHESVKSSLSSWSVGVGLMF